MDLTLGEKEQAFLEALSVSGALSAYAGPTQCPNFPYSPLQSFYYDGKPAMSDAEFDLLKDELLWSGSKVAVLTTNEQKFLEASMAYNAGKPFMSNEDFDKLKATLRKENSVVTAEGPRCSLRSRKMYSDATVDYLRLVGLNIPAAVTILFGLFAIDDLTGFEVTRLLELPEPFGIIVVWGVVLPIVYILSNAVTNLVFKDALVLKAACPKCGTENFSYFGDILTVSGNRGQNTVVCTECSAKLVFDAEMREVEVTPEETATA